MTQFYFTTLLACMFFATPALSQQIALQETKTIMNTLADDNKNGRYTGSQGFDDAAKFVEEFLQEKGFQPLFDTYKDSFKGEKNVDAYNIVAINQSYNPEKRTIILSGHLDHMGTINKGEDRIMNGANDNASGVTAAMQISAFLCQLETIDENVIVALFSGEEQGLLGSSHLAKKMKESEVSVDYGFNFEMIGAMLTDKPNTVYLTGYKMSNMADVINEAADDKLVIFFKGAKKLDLFYRSDNYPFYENFDIPAQTFSSFDFTNYDYYHHVSDEVSELDLENMNDIINSLAAALQIVLETDQEIKLKK